LGKFLLDEEWGKQERSSPTIHDTLSHSFDGRNAVNRGLEQE
jgi:hypothetical protein